jgi:hypothetical protein
MIYLKPNTEYNSIAFSGCGLLVPYHLGVVKCLNDNNINFKKASGVSAGAYGAGAILGLAHLDLGIRQSYDLMVNSTVGPFGSLLDNVEDYIGYYMKNDAWEKAKNRWYVICATGFRPKTIICNDFRSSEELRNAVIGGCWLPGIFGMKARRYKDKIIYDHGLIDGAYPLEQSSVLVSLLTTKSAFTKRLTDITIEADRSVFPALSWMMPDKKNPELFHRNTYVTGYNTCQSMIEGEPKKKLVDVLSEYQVIMDHLASWRDMNWT